MTAEAPPVPGGLDQRTGDTPLGRLTMADRVVEKIAAQVASEVPDVGGDTGRGMGVIGRSPARGELGTRPNVSATIDNGIAEISLALSVRWPAPVVQVADRVRHEVREQVRTLTGVVVDDVTITVTDLVGEPTGRRVR